VGFGDLLTHLAALSIPHRDTNLTLFSGLSADSWWRVHDTFPFFRIENRSNRCVLSSIPPCRKPSLPSAVSGSAPNAVSGPGLTFGSNDVVGSSLPALSA
jgi:hypothetical protein